MAISNRLRFEVLRRDNFTCHYCGRKPPQVEMTLDHVNPRALGGQDVPENLVAACTECNGGKTSVPPDAELVASVAAIDEVFQDAMHRATKAVLANIEREKDALASFRRRWERWTYPDDSTIPLPDWWERSVRGLWRRSVQWELIEHAILIAMTNPDVKPDGKFPYFLGVVKRSETDVVEIASHIFKRETRELDGELPGQPASAGPGWGDLCECGRRKIASPAEDLPA